MIALAATLHDPSGALAPLVRRTLPVLAAAYPGGIAVTTSPPTHQRIRVLLDAAGVYAGSPATNARGPLYRLAIRAALARRPDHVHYLDFDRAIHWAARHPRDLRAFARRARRFGALLVGRTEKAHRSHHRPLYATEIVVNRLLADRLGWSGRVDFLVPSFVLERDAARALLRRSRARDESIYGEWAAIVATLVPSLAYVECGALDWETPDRHRRAIRRVGLARWRARQDRPAEWTARVAMAQAIVAGFQRALRRAGSPAALVRLRPRSPAPRTA